MNSIRFAKVKLTISIDLFHIISIFSLYFSLTRDRFIHFFIVFFFIFIQPFQRNAPSKNNNNKKNIVKEIENWSKNKPKSSSRFEQIMWL